MKYSIDFNSSTNRVSGWLSLANNESLESCHVLVEGLFGKRFIVNSFVFREDVKALGLHPTGMCGFIFYPVENGFTNGDFLRVSLYDGSGYKGCKVILLDSEKKIKKIFNELEYERNDFSVMEASTLDLFKNNADLLAFKILLIRLRRAKRAKGWRGKFSGYEYSYFDDDWRAFFHVVDVCRWSLFDVLTVRYLWSVIDTFADTAIDGERLAMLSLSVMLMQEKLGQTRKNIYDSTLKVEPVLDRQQGYWGGMATTRLSHDDALDVYITRMIDSLSDYPIAYSFFIDLYFKMIDEKESFLALNINNSSYFKGAIDFYSNMFRSERSRLINESFSKNF